VAFFREEAKKTLTEPSVKAMKTKEFILGIFHRNTKRPGVQNRKNEQKTISLIRKFLIANAKHFKF
jgi:hypothetical protein